MKMYYTPTIEEFHEGFTFESQCQDGTWEPDIWTGQLHSRIDAWIKDERIRVKHLDRNDIESLGWIPYLTEPIDRYFFVLASKSGTHWRMHFEPRAKFVAISADTGKDWFVGYLNNISELRRVMRQINIKP